MNKTIKSKIIFNLLFMLKQLKRFNLERFLSLPEKDQIHKHHIILEEVQHGEFLFTIKRKGDHLQVTLQTTVSLNKMNLPIVANGGVPA